MGSSLLGTTTATRNSGRSAQRSAAWTTATTHQASAAPVRSLSRAPFLLLFEVNWRLSPEPVGSRLE